MNHLIKRVVVCLPLIISACTDNTAKKPSPMELKVPDSVQFVKPEPGQKLTKDQVEQIKKMLGKKAVMELPPGELIFPHNDTPKSEIAKQEEKLRRTDVNSYNLLKEIQGTCGKGRPTGHVEATVPLDGGPVDNMQAGDNAGMSGSAGLLGTNCVMPLDVGAGASMKVEEIDKVNREGMLSANLNEKVNILMKNPKYAQLLNSRGVMLNLNVSGLAVMREDELDKTRVASSKVHMKFKIAGSYLTLDNEIPLNVEVEGISKETATQSTFESLFSADLKFPGFNVNIVRHETGLWDKNPPWNGERTLKIYVNGFEVTEDEFREIFGQSQEPIVKKASGMF